MKLQDLTRVENLNTYLEQIQLSRPTASQSERLKNIAEIENIIRHVNLLANDGFLRSVEQGGFSAMLGMEEVAESWDTLMSHPALIPYTQILLLLLYVTEEPTEGEEEAADPAD